MFGIISLHKLEVMRSPSLGGRVRLLGSAQCGLPMRPTIPLSRGVGLMCASATPTQSAVRLGVRV